MKAYRLFSFARNFGSFILLVPMALLLTFDSPYVYGKEAALWFIPQFGAGILLFMAAISGEKVTAPHEEGALYRLRPFASTILIGLMMLAVIYAAILVILTGNTVVIEPTFVDYFAAWVARITTIFALLVGALAIYYNMWVLRLEKR